MRSVNSCAASVSRFLDQGKCLPKAFKNVAFSWLSVDSCNRDFLRLRNMLLKATFPSSYFGLVEATPAAKKKWVPCGTACYKFMGVKNTSLSQPYVIYSTPFRRAAYAYSPSKRCNHASQNHAQQQSAWQTHSNCRHFLDNLYQIQFSDCSAPPESRL